MHDTGGLGLVHWDDPEGWYGEGVLVWEAVNERVGAGRGKKTRQE